MCAVLDSYKVMSVIEQYPPARQDTVENEGGWRGGGGKDTPTNPQNTMHQLHINKYVMFD